jgi:hypothetical protein
VQAKRTSRRDTQKERERERERAKRASNRSYILDRSFIFPGRWDDDNEHNDNDPEGKDFTHHHENEKRGIEGRPYHLPLFISMLYVLSKPSSLSFIQRDFIYLQPKIKFTIVLYYIIAFINATKYLLYNVGKNADLTNQFCNNIFRNLFHHIYIEEI